MSKYDALFEDDVAVVEPRATGKYAALFEETTTQPTMDQVGNDEPIGYFSGINKAMDDKAVEYAQKNLEPEKYPLQHAVQKFNAIVDIPLAGASKALDPVKPALKSAVKGIFEGAAFVGGNRDANPNGTKKVIGEAIAPAVQKFEEVKDKYPVVDAASELVGEGGQLFGNLVGVGGAAKLSKGVAEGVAEGLKGSGLKVQNVTAKISQRGAKEGAKIETIAKHNLWGNATKVQEKSLDLIKEKASQLKNVIEKSNVPGTETNLYEVINNSMDDVLKNSTFDKDKIRSTYQKAINDIVETHGGNTEKLDLVSTNMLKREVGKRGDWLEYNGKRSGNPDASVEAQVFNDIYDKLKKSVENKGSPEIKKLNKELSELIPLERDMARRSLVEKRNEIIPLKEYIGVIGAIGSGNPAVMGAVALQQASKSPTVGKALYKTGKAMEDVSKKKIGLKKKQYGALTGMEDE